MTKDEALKLALKALRFARDDGYENEVSQEAITAIKQAIADSALDRMAENARELGLDYAPVQEPVALKPCWYESKEKTMCRKCGQVHAEAIPPVAQPALKTLTDEEMKIQVEAELVNYWNGEYADTTGAKDCLTDFARAIEVTLREQNGFNK